MAIKPYTIIEIFRSKGFDPKEAEEIVDFIAESSQEKVLDAIKDLATGSEVEMLSSEVKMLSSEVEMLSSEVKMLSSEVKMLSSEVKMLETRLSDKIELRIKDTELRLIKWLTGTGIAIIGTLIAAMKYIIK